MSDHKPTFETPSHTFGNTLERITDDAEFAIRNIQDTANKYISDLEHALASAEAERLELYDALTNLRDFPLKTYGKPACEAVQKADAAISNYRAKMR